MHDLSAVWNTDAPPGQAWQCPDCASWATLGGNAAFHANKMKHGVPTLVPMPKPKAPSYQTAPGNMIVTYSNGGEPCQPFKLVLCDGIGRAQWTEVPADIAARVTAGQHIKRIFAREDGTMCLEIDLTLTPFRAELERRVEAARVAADEVLNQMQPDDAIMATELRAQRWEVRESHLGLSGALAQSNVKMESVQALHGQAAIRRYLRLRAALAEVE